MDVGPLWRSGRYREVAARTMTKSPDGFYYRFDPKAPAGQRLTRRASLDQPWGVGRPEFSVQLMSSDELRFVAAFIDDAIAPTVYSKP